MPTPAASAVLRALLRSRGRPATGEQILERVFAMTAEVPLDPDRVCAAVRELETSGLVRVDRTPPLDPGFDFATVTMTAAGEGAI